MTMTRRGLFLFVVVVAVSLFQVIEAAEGCASDAGKDCMDVDSSTSVNTQLLQHQHQHQEQHRVDQDSSSQTDPVVTNHNEQSHPSSPDEMIVSSVDVETLEVPFNETMVQIPLNEEQSIATDGSAFADAYDSTLSSTNHDDEEEYEQEDDENDEEGEDSNNDEEEDNSQPPEELPNPSTLPPLECGLYMAESSIPHAGWGMYTAKPLLKGDIFLPTDVVIQSNDIKEYLTTRNRLHDPPLPEWLLNEYYWNSQISWANFDAQRVDSIIPGLGMLANSHTGLVNAENLGPQVKASVRRQDPEAGAYTEYRNLTLTALQDIPAGHELFVEYGDEWFQDRDKVFGEGLPLSDDWTQADEILQSMKTFCRGNFTTPFCRDLWQLTRHDIQKAVSPRILTALPETLEGVKKVLDSRMGTAFHSVPNLIRSPEWLHQHGLCLDHMTVDDSTIKMAGQGAFATRDLPQGTIVSPAPVIHLHRGHLEQFFVDQHDKSQVHWTGHQLLLNYVYGHKDSSLVFFPYAPVSNLINHSRDPNTKLRWSSVQSKPEWMKLTTKELIEENAHAGLMMEFVAIRDISEGDEITVDYGEEWEHAWKEHVLKWDKSDYPEEYHGAHEFRVLEVLPAYNEQNHEVALPTNVMTVCWVNNLAEPENGGNVWEWRNTDTDSLGSAKRCWIDGHDDGKDTYTVTFLDKNQKYQKVRGLPRHAIYVVDRPYTSNQYLRAAFRHEAHLPDEMVPNNWRDLAEAEEECQYYMAESSIANAGLGMYTAKALKADQDIFFSDLVIQVEDMEMNQKLRRWNLNTNEEAPLWLMENYFWNSVTTAGDHEADNVQSIVPGLGMLANSHDGLVNAHMVRAKLDSHLQRHVDPGAGAMTYYHNLKFTAGDDLEAGSEIFVQYGSEWFLHRAGEMGPVPINDDFEEADKMMMLFWDIIGGDPDKEMAADLWDILWNTSSPVEDNRVRMALPRDLGAVENVLDIGTARNSVPKSIRSLSWLKENGLCIDNIMPKRSTIPQAGMGAFSTRHIPKGDVVAPAPLVHIRREHMEIYDSRDVDNPKSKIWFDGRQLILNYCYGHPNSSILLFPYAPVTNYINHGKEDANVGLRWSTLPNHRSHWFNRSVDDLMTEDHAGLIMEYVALRDIKPNEEILLDYGDRWNEAWEEYVRGWVPTRNANGYVGAWLYNDFMTPVLTMEEQKTHPYPDNVVTYCYVGPVNHEQPATRSKYGDLTYDWTFYDDLYEKTAQAYVCDILERHGKDDDTFQSMHPDRETYIARVERTDDKEWILLKVPRRAIEFFDNQYESDLFLRTAFRHEIGLPDHLLAEAWKDQ